VLQAARMIPRIQVFFAAFPARIVSILVCACVVCPLAPAQPWGIANTRTILAASANASTSAALSPAGEVYTLILPDDRTASVAKLDPTGNPLYTVTLRGIYEAGIVFDSASNVYVTGTATTSFKTTPGAYRSTALDHSAFVCKMNPANGAIQYCTLLDPADIGFAAVDGSGSVAVVFGPYSGGGPLTSGALNAGKKIYVEKLNPTGTALVYAAKFGGSVVDYPQAAAIDSTGSLFITGRTYSSDFPITPNAAVSVNPSAPSPGFETQTSFTVRLNPAGSAFLYSTLGNAGEQGLAIRLDPSGNAQVLEQDVDNNLFLRRYKSDGSGILFEAPLNVAWSSSVGEIPQMGIDAAGVTTVLGPNVSIAFPPYQAVQPCQFTSAGVPNAFLLRIDPSGHLLESTWLQPPGLAFSAGLSVNTVSGLELFWRATEPTQVANELDLVILGPQTAPPLNLACIGNAASFQGAPISPGEIVSLFGSGIGPTTPASAQFGSNQRFPTQVSNTQVTFDGVPAPLLYVSSTQINAVAPFGLAPNNTTQVCVSYEGTITNCIAASVSAAAPGVFLNPATPGYAVALNQDGTINSQANPLRAGSIVTLFATGLGSVTPAPPDGSLTPVPLPVQNLQIRVEVPNPDQHSPQPYFTTAPYAGPAPLEIAGLTQLNVQVPGFLLEYSGPFAVWVTLPDGTSAKSPPFNIWIAP
jgi:uncharacterized protein (TIGR03437 family)